MILAIDPSVHSLGWAYGDGTPANTIIGTKSFSHCTLDYGFLFMTYKGWVCDMITEHQPTILAIESTYPGIKGKAGYLLNNLNGATHTAAYVHDIDRIEFTPKAVKKFFTSNGNASKIDMFLKAEEMGFNVSNDDEADAVAVLLTAIDYINQKKKEE